jgi:hypothetical protein
LLLILLASFSSCAGIFHLDAGGRQSTYQEKPKSGNLEQALSSATGRTIVIIEGEKSAYRTTGVGPHFGISYETMFLMQKYNNYSIDYEPLSYTYSIDGSSPVRSDLKVKAKGHDYQVGFKLGVFRPRVSLKREDIQIESFSGTSSDTIYYMGYGLTIDFHLIQGLHVYAGWDKRFRISSDPLLSITTTDITFGILIRPWEWFSFGSGKPAYKTYSSPFFEIL